MKIKIIKADETSWYKHLVGKVREARISANILGGYIIRNYRTLLRTVKKEHAEIIEP